MARVAGRWSQRTGGARRAGGGPVSGAGRARVTISQRDTGERSCVAWASIGGATVAVTGTSNTLRTSGLPVAPSSTRSWSCRCPWCWSRRVAPCSSCEGADACSCPWTGSCSCSCSWWWSWSCVALLPWSSPACSSAPCACATPCATASTGDVRLATSARMRTVQRDQKVRGTRGMYHQSPAMNAQTRWEKPCARGPPENHQRRHHGSDGGACDCPSCGRTRNLLIHSRSEGRRRGAT